MNVDDPKREARKLEQAKMMWLVLGAIYNKIANDGVAHIEAGSPTSDMIAEIVAKVEGWA